MLYAFFALSVLSSPEYVSGIFSIASGCGPYTPPELVRRNLWISFITAYSRIFLVPSEIWQYLSRGDNWGPTVDSVAAWSICVYLSFLGNV